ncbi:MAG: CHAT domain-containing protein [Desulfobacterales bacterium]|nr:CHAT domain-containing protein [Desulfobacterales bacterium]
MIKKQIFITLLIIVAFAPTIRAESAPETISRGRTWFQKGDYGKAIMAWERALGAVDPEKNPGPYLDVVVHLARAHQIMGYYDKAFALLHEAMPVAEKCEDRRRRVQFLGLLGDLHLCLGNLPEASRRLTPAIEEARLTNNPRLQAAILIGAGNLFAADRDFQGALDTWSEAMELAEEAGDQTLKVKALVNALYTASMVPGYENFDSENARDEIEKLPDSSEKARLLLQLGYTIRKIRKTRDEEKKEARADKLSRAEHDVFDRAARIGEALNDPRTISHASGAMGRLYEEEKRLPEALALTRRAIFFAPRGSVSDILYKWQWQAGRLFAGMGRMEEAADAYKNAVSTLNPIRVGLFSGKRAPGDAFAHEVKPVYLGLAELLLKQAAAAAGDDARESKLKEARDVMEMLKTAELEDFFEDECATLMDSKARTLDRAPAGAAVIYPIVFPDRLVLLLTLSDGLSHVEASVDAETLEETVILFRKRLQNRMNNHFLNEAEKLYDWIIRPIEAQLVSRGVHTLIFAPDGALRLIPLTTLYDGERFLVEKYAVGLIPAITLTDPRPFDGENASILLSGLSEARREFSPLPSVPGELKDIKTIMSGRMLLMNERFTGNELAKEFTAREYTIFHIATHGVFGGSPDESFLLTHDGRLTMNGLEKLIDIGRFRENPVELLTLSACQTALGNERAALGLAGAAVKAGVRAVTATLWYVDDEATSLAIREFYRQLRKPGISKVNAMRNAQISLIEKPRYWHPIYWAPFLLIGNWQ